MSNFFAEIFFFYNFLNYLQAKNCIKSGDIYTVFKSDFF
jgi:hypothetical protein